MAHASEWLRRFRGSLSRCESEPDFAAYRYADRDGLFQTFSLSEEAESWLDFERWVSGLKGPWCFRGQREADWLLKTSLDRTTRVETSGGGYYHRDREEEQSGLLISFQNSGRPRDIPPLGDISSWLALMQHSGAATRLLDWTRSPYIALYFALHEAAVGDRSVVWAIDLEWLEERARASLPPRLRSYRAGDASSQNQLLSATDVPVIVQIVPPRPNERMIAQEGILLCKLYHKATVDQILITMMIHPEPVDRPVVRRIEVPKDIRMEFLAKLGEMGINKASLFPDLEARTGEKACFGRDLANILAKARLSPSEARAWRRDPKAARKSLLPPSNKWET